MERIIIIGCGGAGKSTLARQLGEKLRLPVVHLDQIFWSPGNWHHLEKEEFDSLLLQEMEKPRWIMDGNFNRTMLQRLGKCDTVIYLDFNRFVCLFGWLKRVVTNWGRTRADMGPNCKEWFAPEMFHWIWTYNKTKRPQNYRLLEQATHAKVIILKNRAMVSEFLSEI